MKKIPREKINTDLAFNRHERICNREQQRRTLFLQNVIDLTEMFETQEFKAILGFDPIPKWSGYLGMIEIYYSRAEIERWRKIYLTLVKDFGLKFEDLLSVPESRLGDIASYAGVKEVALDLIGKAKHNTSQDWRDSIAEVRGRPISHDCIHQDEIYGICKRCGFRHKVN